MSNLTQLNQNFDNFLKNNFSVSDNYCLKLISKLLEECDLELTATRDKSLEIVKKYHHEQLSEESLNGWMKEELFLDFDLGHSLDVKQSIIDYVKYYNNERPAYSLKYKTPTQFKPELVLNQV